MILEQIRRTKQGELLLGRRRQPEVDGLTHPVHSHHSLERALRRDARSHGLALIAECKRHSPSRGHLAVIADAADLAQSYARGGASAISVLTDRDYFHGSADDLRMIRRAVHLPLLRKDFVIHPWQVRESAALGADAVLLILRLLGEDGTARALEECRRWHLDALVEVHTAAEAELAVRLGAPIIGVNNRDLDTFHVDRHLATTILPTLPQGRLLVAESGYSQPDEVADAARAGAAAVLVGEALVRADEPAERVRQFVAMGAAARLARSTGLERSTGPIAETRSAQKEARLGSIGVKICGLDSLAATRAAVAAGVDAVGWVFVPGRRRQVEPALVERWAREVPPTVLRTGVFAGQSIDEVGEVADRCGLDSVQLHGGEDAGYVRRLRQELPGVHVVVAIRSIAQVWTATSAPAAGVAASESVTPAQTASPVAVDRWLLDPGAGGRGRAFADLDAVLPARAAEAVTGAELWLAGGLTPENVASVLRQALRRGVVGVDVSSGVEIDGRKSPTRIASFVRAVRNVESVARGTSK